MYDHKNHFNQMLSAVKLAHANNDRLTVYLRI